LFSSQGKKQRETWVVEAWCRLSSRQKCLIVERQRPEFTVDNEKVEIVEVLYPGRNRQAELTNDAQAISEERFPEPRVAGSFEEIQKKPMNGF
jgi:hypothetical protein